MENESKEERSGFQCAIVFADALRARSRRDATESNENGNMHKIVCER